MGRLLGLDVGDRRIGIALSDPTRTLATPFCVYTRVGYTPDVAYITAIFREKQADAVVCGLPLNMDGSRGFQADKVLALAERIREAGVPVEFQDERLSTVTAHDMMTQNGLDTWQSRRGGVDKVAAAVILQTYLDRNK